MQTHEIEIVRVILGSIIRKVENPNGGEIWSYYLNGALRMRAEILNKEPDGPFVLFYENGSSWIKGTYKNGKRNFDAWKVYLPNGDEIPKK